MNLHTKRRRVLFLACIAMVLCGLVFVKNSNKFTKPANSCNNLPVDSKNQCYIKETLKQLDINGLESALNTMAMYADSDKQFSQACHTAMHDLGKAAYYQYVKNGVVDVNDKLSYCNYGFYHSFIEAMILETGGIEMANNFCLQIAKNNDSLTVSNCYHGIGHGISSEPEKVGTVYEMSLPGLNLCNKITQENGYRRSCLLGVFNSMVFLYDNPKYKLTPPINAFTLCTENNYNEEEKSACFLQMSPLAIQLASDDLLKQFNNALTIDEKYKSEVFYDLATYNIQGNKPENVINTCREVAPKFIKDCIKGTAAGLKVFGYLGNEYKRAIDFYQNAHLSGPEKETFLNYLLVLDVNSTEEQNAVCQKFPKELRIGPCTAIN